MAIDDSKHCDHRTGMVFFASVPPPLHGQSVMVGHTLQALKGTFGDSIIRHVDARWSDDLGEIGGTGFRKLKRLAIYPLMALRERLAFGRCLLYYVPGPVKWSALIRDWLVLGVLRPFFSGTVFHWHAVGQGEWAHGSQRVSLNAPRWIDSVARFLSRIVLHRPLLSLPVSQCSDTDARAVGSKRIEVVANGIRDPLAEAEAARLAERFEAMSEGRLRLLFLSRGNEEKGLSDWLEAILHLAAAQGPDAPELHIRIVGGVEPSASTLVGSFKRTFAQTDPSHRIEIEWQDFADESAKKAIWETTDLLVYPSRWESFGLVVLEAMARAVPVIACSSDGVRGILGPDSPLLVPVTDPVALASRVREFIADKKPVHWQTIGLGLRRRFLDDFDLARFDRDVIRALAGVIRKS
jgi:glycosyltransferase involved in cell wall biosynthesis